MLSLVFLEKMGFDFLRSRFENGYLQYGNGRNKGRTDGPDGREDKNSEEVL